MLGGAASRVGRQTCGSRPACPAGAPNHAVENVTPCQHGAHRLSAHSALPPLPRPPTCSQDATCSSATRARASYHRRSTGLGSGDMRGSCQSGGSGMAPTQHCTSSHTAPMALGEATTSADPGRRGPVACCASCCWAASGACASRCSRSSSAGCSAMPSSCCCCCSSCCCSWSAKGAAPAASGCMLSRPKRASSSASCDTRRARGAGTGRRCRSTLACGPGQVQDTRTPSPLSGWEEIRAVA